MISADKFRRTAKAMSDEKAERAYVDATMARDPADRPWQTATEIAANTHKIKKDKLKAFSLKEGK